MEDASGVDLDWFWFGWFYTTWHCDIAIDSVKWFAPTDGDPDKAAEWISQQRQLRTPSLSEQRNADLPKRADRFPELKDFYNDYDPEAATPEAQEAHRKMMESLTDEERDLLQHSDNYYQINRKHGWLTDAVILQYPTRMEPRCGAIACWNGRDNQNVSTSIISPNGFQY